MCKSNPASPICKQLPAPATAALELCFGDPKADNFGAQGITLSASLCASSFLTTAAEDDDLFGFPTIGWSDHFSLIHEEASLASLESSKEELREFAALHLDDQQTNKDDGNHKSSSGGGLLRSKRLVSSLYNLRDENIHHNNHPLLQRRKTMGT